MTLISRTVLFNRIGQSHLRPNMTAAKLEEILNRYPLGLDSCSDAELRQIVSEIAGIVNYGKRYHETWNTEEPA